jgi:hypothetical protein
MSRECGSMAGASQIYESLLRVGKQKKICTACNRGMDDHELIVFEKHVCHFLVHLLSFLTLDCAVERPNEEDFTRGSGCQQVRFG